MLWTMDRSSWNGICLKCAYPLVCRLYAKYWNHMQWRWSSSEAKLQVQIIYTYGIYLFDGCFTPNILPDISLTRRWSAVAYRNKQSKNYLHVYIKTMANSVTKPYAGDGNHHVSLAFYTMPILYKFEPLHNAYFLLIILINWLVFMSKIFHSFIIWTHISTVIHI